MANTITQRIVLEGGQQVKAQLTSIGDAGQQAFNQIKVAADKLNVQSTLAAVDAASVQAGRGFKTFAERVAAASQGVSAATAAATAAATDFGKGAAKAAADAEAVGAAATNSAGGLRLFGSALRGIGKLAGASELAVFGKSLALVGRNIAALALPIAVAGFERISASAAKASDSIQQAAFEAGDSTDKFQELANVGAVAGIGAEEFGKGMNKLHQELIKTAQAEDDHRKKIADLKDQLNTARDAVNTAAQAFVKLGDEQRKSAQRFAAENQQVVRSLEDIQSAEAQLDLDRKKFASTDFKNQDDKARAALSLANQERQLERQKEDASNRQLELIQKQQEEEKKFAEEQRKAALEMEKAVIAQEKVEAAVRAANRELETNGTTLQKLGIQAKDASGGIKSNAEALKEFADKFAAFPEGTRKNQIAVDLFGESARKMAIVLNEGSAGVTKLIAEQERLGLGLDKTATALGDKFVIASTKAVEVLTDLKNKFGLAISPAFTQFFNSIAESLAAATPGLTEFARVLGTVLTPILQGVAVAFDLIVKGFSAVASLFDLLAAGINKLFGKETVTGVQLLSAAIIGLGAVFLIAFAPIPALITGLLLVLGLLGPKITEFANKVPQVLKGVGEFFAQLGTKIKDVFFEAIDFVKTTLADAAQFFIDSWNATIEFFATLPAKFVEFVTSIGKSLVEGFNAAIEQIKGFFVGLWEKVKSIFNDIVQAAKDVVEKVKSFFGGSGVSAGGGGGGGDLAQPGGFAGGGYVRGPGSSMSDSIPARLSHGEFVMRAAAVKKYGAALFHALNSMRLPKASFQGFNMGGLVEAIGDLAVPRANFATGGLVSAGTSGGRPVSLHIGNDTITGLVATADSVQQMQRFATRRAVSAAGRKPTWFRG